MTKNAVNKQLKALVGRIQEVRGNRSQRQFAADIGVFQQNVNRYEFGTMPTLPFLIQLADEENVNLNWLLTGKGLMYTLR